MVCSIDRDRSISREASRILSICAASAACCALRRVVRALVSCVFILHYELITTFGRGLQGAGNARVSIGEKSSGLLLRHTDLQRQRASVPAVSSQHVEQRRFHIGHHIAVWLDASACRSPTCNVIQIKARPMSTTNLTRGYTWAASANPAPDSFLMHIEMRGGFGDGNAVRHVRLRHSRQPTRCLMFRAGRLMPQPADDFCLGMRLHKNLNRDVDQR